MDTNAQNFIAFDGSQRIAFGPLSEVALKVKERHDAAPFVQTLIFNSMTSELVDLDLRGTAEQVLSRLAMVTTETSPSGNSSLPETHAPTGPGRPKLGVVAREVTLLPRHWEWLNSQPGGASVTLRKLVEQAKRASHSADRVRLARESAFRFMSAMAGNLEGFEEATRALFAGDRPRFDALTAVWPNDIREHLQQLTDAAFPDESDQDAYGA